MRQDGTDAPMTTGPFEGLSSSTTETERYSARRRDSPPVCVHTALQEHRRPIAGHPANAARTVSDQSWRLDQSAASFSFLSGRTFSLVEAGFAANQTSSLVKGLMPLRLGLAGTFTAVILRRPGSTN